MPKDDEEKKRKKSLEKSQGLGKEEIVRGSD
jgi:hypothetical protein